MKIFGHIRSLGPGDVALPIGTSRPRAQSSRGVYGAGVAERSFFKALLHYADFDEFHFYLPRGYLARERTFRKDYFGEFEGDERIRLFELESLRENLSKYTYHVFHQPLGLAIGPLIYLRNLLSPRNFPITGITHTISYQFFLATELAQLVLQRTEPWDSIICPSATARKALGKLLKNIERNFRERGTDVAGYRGRLDLIPLGVDTEICAPRPKQAIRKELNLPQDACIFLWLGRFSHYDKTDLAPLLFAFKKAFSGKRFQRVILLLVGDDSRHSYASQLEQLAASLGIGNRVIFRTNPSFTGYPTYYSAADVFVSPCDNIQETFGLAVLEAMSSGLPVICSDWDGFRATVQHGKTGYLVPTYWMKCDKSICDYAPAGAWKYDHFYLSQSVCVDLELLVGYMRELAANQNLRAKMSANARMRAVASFRWESVISRYEVLWAELSHFANGRNRKKSRTAWFRPAYFDVFKGYATAILNDRTHLRASRSRFALEAAFHQHPEMSSFLNLPFCHAILDSAARTSKISTLRAGVETFCVPDELFQIHLMWLAKYGYLEVRRASST
jgi:D-inositol-3-phosphate glycosyltransferase